MAIIKIDSIGTTPIAFVSPAIAQIAALLQNVEQPLRVIGSVVKKGSLFNIGGAMYIADADTNITGTASDYVKITPAGATASASYVANLTGVTWNTAYNGYYDGTGNLYIFDEAKALSSGAISTIYTIRNAGMAPEIASGIAYGLDPKTGLVLGKDQTLKQWQHGTWVQQSIPQTPSAWVPNAGTYIIRTPYVDSPGLITLFERGNDGLFAGEPGYTQNIYSYVFNGVYTFDGYSQKLTTGSTGPFVWYKKIA